MAALVAWLGISTAVAVVGLSRPKIPIAVALLLLGLVPASASPLLTGVPYDESSGLPSLHPGTWVVVVAAAVTLIFRPGRLIDPIARASYLSWVLWMLGVGIAVATTLLSRGSFGLSQILETLVAPGLLALLVVAEVRRDPAWRRSALLSLQAYGLAVACLSVLEGLLRTDLVWGGTYALESWHISYGLDGFRATVFGGHPLNTALVLLACLPLMRMRLTGRFRPGILGSVIVLAGIAATGSRSALVIAVAYLLLASLRSAKTAAPAFVTLAALAVIVQVSPFGQRWLERLSTDTNSSYVRFGALSDLFSNLGDFVMTGRGVGFSGEVSRDLLGQAVSFEDGFVMMALDVGVLGTVILVASMAFLAFRGGFRHWTPITSAFCMAMVMCAAYSSFGTKSPAAYVPWLLAALAPAITVRHSRKSPPTRNAEPLVELSVTK
jgi:hypothetical protein